MTRRFLFSVSTLRYDIGAGVVVFLVALPLCLGIAQAIGVSPLAGLLTGVIGGIVVTLFSASPLSVSGPAAGLIALTIGAITTLGSYGAVLTALVIAGMFQCLFGLLRIGRLAPLIPNSVIQGMLAAIGIMLILQQLPIAFGYLPDLPIRQDVTLHVLRDITPGSVAIMLGSLILMGIWQTSLIKKSPWLGRLPAPLLAVLWGVAYVAVSPLMGDGMRIPDAQRVQLPSIASDVPLALLTPDWRALTQPAVYPLAFALAVVASLETLLSLEATAKIDPQRRIPSPNRELLAQGTGNMLSGFLGGLPITAVIVRSSANVYAGAHTRLSALLHGFLLLGSALFLTPLINQIPLASLAAILLFTGYKLASPRILTHQWAQGALPTLAFLITLAGILWLGMLEGIALGVVSQLLFSVYQAGKYTLSMTHYEDNYLLRVHQNITFLGKPALRHYLGQIPPGATLHVESDANIRFWDPDILEILREFAQTAASRQIRVQLPDAVARRLQQLPAPPAH